MSNKKITKTVLNQQPQVVVNIQAYKRKVGLKKHKVTKCKDSFFIAPGMKSFLEALVEKMVREDLEKNIELK